MQEKITAKHILMLPSWYLPEGGQFCRNQAQMLTCKGIKANVLANVLISMKKYKLKALTLPWCNYSSLEDDLFVLRRFTRSIPRCKILNGLVWSWLTVRMYKKYCKIYGKPDLIHVHSVLWGGYAAYLIKKKYKIPYIITEHKGVFCLSCDFAKQQFEDWQTPYMEKAFSNANAIVPVSLNQTAKIKTYLKNDVLIHSISNVVDTEFFHYKERTIGDVINFVAVNGFMHVKAYDIMLPAFDKACEKLPNIRLKIVGENFEGKEFDKLWQSVKHKDKISFTGELDKYGVREELWNSNIFIISSRVESQSVSTLEALSTGLPIVCTNVVPSTVANINNSLVVPVEDVKSLTIAIIEMSKSFQNYLGKEISADLALLASKSVVTEKILGLYSLILKKHRSETDKNF